MFDTDLDEIIREAYASAPAHTIVLHTLEILHPAFDKPARVCRWPITGDEPDVFKCLLEPDAPQDAGKIVDFLGVPFDIITPEKSSEQLGTFTFRVDNIGDALDEELEAAVMHGTPIKGTYREYIKGTESTTGPRAVWEDITLGDLHMEGQSIVASGALLDWMFKPFGWLYLPSDYPSLVRGR